MHYSSASGIKILFAHRTFKWESEARGKAHVHVVILGFATFDIGTKQIYDYEGKQTTVARASNISPYLIEGSDVALTNCYSPICSVPEIGIGNKPIDGGYYLFTAEEKDQFLKKQPNAKVYFRRWFGSKEFLHGIERWCLWLGHCEPSQLRHMPECKRLIELVADYRRGKIPAKGKEPTEKNIDRNELTIHLANTPTRFHVENMPTSSFLVIPETGSDRRRYLPVGFMQPSDGLCSNLVKMMPNATLFHFAILSSAMHAAWMRYVGGRMKSDPRYSVKLVYNNFPWPEPTPKQQAAVEKAAQAVLDARKNFPDSTLADLYDPLSMPPALVKAHAELDRAVDLCYRPQPFENDRQRVEHLFALYEKLTAPLLPAAKKPRTRHKVTVRSSEH